jgi:hypothetical protein
VKARIGQAKTIPYYDSAGEIVGGPFVVEVLSQASGAVMATLTLTQTLVPALYLSETTTFATAGSFDLKFKNGDPLTVVATDVLTVGTSPVPDAYVGVAAPLTVSKTLTSGVDKVVTAKVFDGAGAVFAGPAEFAKYVGNQAITTLSVSNNDFLTIHVLPDANVVGAQTAIFLCEHTEAPGGDGNYAGNSPGDTATYRIDGGLQRIIDLSAVAAGKVAYLAALNAQFIGAYAENTGGDTIKIVTDSLGSSSKITLSGFGNSFGANTGLVEGIYASDGAKNNVANSDTVTFSEVKAIIESGVAEALSGDRIVVTQEATTNNLVLTATSGSAGTSSNIDLQAGTAGLLTSLGLTGLGSQGGGFIAPGSDGTTIPAIYSTSAVGYVTSEITLPSVGDYFIVWHRADQTVDPQVPFHFEALFLTGGASEEQVNIRVLNPEPDSMDTAANHPLNASSHAPHTDTKVYISDKDGSPVSYGITDHDGRVRLAIGPGVYYVTLVKDNVVFGTNNYRIVIQDSRAILPNWLLTVPAPYGSPVIKSPTNGFTLYSKPFSPTITDPAPPAPMCDLYADLYRMDGSALANAEIYVSLVQAPDLLASGTVVYDTKAFYRTDGHGRVTFSLVQGIKVEVAVAPLSIRRIITVPSGDDAAVPVNLFTLLSQADDMFDIIRPNIATAPRRTLS